MEFVGVDVAKQTFDVAVRLPNGKYRTRAKISNCRKGHAEFVAWLKLHAPSAAIGMEATGVYHEALAEYLLAAGFVVFVFNPAQVAAFAKSELARTKSDRYDAKLIVRFCLAQQATGRELRPWAPLPPPQRRLKALVLRLDDLKGMRQEECNRREVADEAVHRSIDELIERLDEQIVQTERAIREHIDNDPDLRDRRELLNSIPGVSDTTSAWLMACLGDTRQFSDVRQAVAFAGLNPRQRESGQWKGQTRISKTGDPRLRAKLYMPAVVAKQHNPVIRAFCQRLSDRGKKPMVVVVAAMRKLIHVAWGVLRSGQPFNADLAVAR